MLWPLLVYMVFVVALVAGMMVGSYILGERHSERATGEPYESGMAPSGSARQRFPARFYLVAMSFLIFDLEAVYIFAWSVSAKDVGWPGYAGVVVFIAVLVAALVYEWRTGALDWGRKPPRAGIGPGAPEDAARRAPASS